MEIGARYLATRPRSRWETARRLRRAGLPEDVTAATVNRLAELGYLDDAAFARWWLEQRDRHAPRGRRLIEDELRQHGVPRDIIDAFRDEYAEPVRAPEDVALPDSDVERAHAALDRHLHGRPMPDDPRAAQRLGMFLMRRGFDAETVRTTLRAAGSGVGDDGDEPAQ
jgi:regulatory protein